MEIITPSGQPRFHTPMSEICEEFALDFREEAGFKEWLDGAGVTPLTFTGKSDAEALAELRVLCQRWEESGAREAMKVLDLMGSDLPTN